MYKPVADEIFLIKEGSIGTQHVNLGQFSRSCGVETDGELLTVNLNLPIVSGNEAIITVKSGWSEGKSK